MWPFNKGDCSLEVTSSAGLTVHVYIYIIWTLFFIPITVVINYLVAIIYNLILYLNCNIFPRDIILLYIWAHKTSLTLPLVIDVRLQRSVWSYQRVNQNSYIEEEQTTQWPKEKTQKDKQRSTKHTHKTKDRLTQTPLKPGWTQFLLH